MDRFMLGFLGLIVLAALPVRAQPSISSGTQTEIGLAAPSEVRYDVDLQAVMLHRAARQDRWWALDKAQHVAFSFLLTLSTQYALENKAGWSRGDALPVSAGTTVVIGLTKETYDWRLGPRRRFSPRDLAANAAGILLAVGVVVL